MNEMLLENTVGRDGARILHVLGSGEPVDKKWLEYVPSAAKATTRRWEDDVRVQHLLATWQAREVVMWTFQTKPWVVRRNVALWYIEPGQKVSQALAQAAECFALNLGRDPQMAFLREIPAGAEEGLEFKGMVLVQAAWVPQGFVFLDNGGGEKLPDYQVSIRAGLDTAAGSRYGAKSAPTRPTRPQNS